MGRSEREFATPGPALRLLGLALSIATFQSARGIFLCAQSLFSGTAADPLPSTVDLLTGLLALAAGAFFLRHADDNAPALATGPSILPPLSLLRLVQPRFEHPLRELWSRSDPAFPEDPMPPSRLFGALWAIGLALAVPSWAFALIAPGSERLAMLVIDAVHHAAVAGACLAALHFAAVLAARQEAAWDRLKPSVITAPLHPPRKPEGPAPAKAAAPAAPAVASRLAEREVERAPSEPLPQSMSFARPRTCVLCNAALSGRRCESCGAPSLAGPFLILRALGGSGGRRTFLARAPDGRQVVVKELSFANAPDAQALEAFAREARTLRELRHPRVPVYVDAFREEEGARTRLYLAYRYLDGVSLFQELEERRYTEDEVLDLVEEVLEILRYLHGLQPPIVHRDLKPSNLIRRNDGKIALIDFGVARDLDRTLQDATMVGTVGYMPPEQLAGQVDVTCDLYALGATALHLLVRRPPWELMDGPELRLPPLKVAPTARVLLRRLLAPRRGQRFSSAREALAALRRLRAGGSRVPWKAWAAAGAGALTLAAIGLAADRRLKADEASAATRAVAPATAAAPPAPQARPPAPGQQPPALRLTTSSVGRGPVAAAPVATWRGGALARSDVEASVRQLPPWLKASKPWWIQQHLLALVRRKLLVAEAERRGLSALMPRFATGADRERLLARALLDIELRKEREPVRAKALRQVWERTTDALIADADLRVDERQLFEIEPEKLLGPAPAYTAIEGMPARLEFFSRTGPCVVEVEPALRRYGGVCEGHRKLSEAFLEPETLQIVDLIPGSVVPAGFFAQLHDEFIESRRTRGDLLEAARRAESSMLRSEVRLMESTGTIYQWSATTVLGLAKPALQRCLALALFQARDEPDKATVRIRVELRPDGSTGTRVESTPAIPADACATMLARPEIGGAGVVTFLAELQRRP